jgi:hypothetical protein
MEGSSVRLMAGEVCFVLTGVMKRAAALPEMSYGLEENEHDCNRDKRQDRLPPALSQRQWLGAKNVPYAERNGSEEHENVEVTRARSEGRTNYCCCKAKTE